VRRRDFIRDSAIASVALSLFGCSANEGYLKVISKAGNMPDHGDRFILLAGLQESGKFPPHLV
jgi:hypothetical protein